MRRLARLRNPARAGIPFNALFKDENQNQNIYGWIKFKKSLATKMIEEKTHISNVNRVVYAI